MQTSDHATPRTAAPPPPASRPARLRARLRRAAVIPPSVRPSVVGTPVATILMIVLGIAASLNPFTVNLGATMAIIDRRPPLETA